LLAGVNIQELAASIAGFVPLVVSPRVPARVKLPGPDVRPDLPNRSGQGIMRAAIAFLYQLIQYNMAMKAKSDKAV